MRIMLKVIKNIFLISLFFVFTNCDQASQSKSSTNSIVVVKVFSSLTCPHCADFHGEVYDKLEKEILPLYYQNRSGFIDIMRHTIALNGSFFNTQRMLQQYISKAYF